MTVPIVSPPMQAKAERLAEMIPMFSRGRSKVDGRQFVIIPASTPGVAHWSNGLGCTCKGFEVRGECTHALAVRIHQQCQEAPRIAEAQANRQQFGQCVTVGCIAAATGKGRRCSEHFAALVAKLGI